jgi:hypothetical protein
VHLSIWPPACLFVTLAPCLPVALCPVTGPVCLAGWLAVLSQLDSLVTRWTSDLSQCSTASGTSANQLTAHQVLSIHLMGAS